MSQEMDDLYVKQIQDKFEMCMVGELSYFLGFQTKKINEEIFTFQSKYAKNLMNKYGLESACAKRTPTPTHVKMSKDSRRTNVDKSLNRSIIEGLLNLTASRPDIASAIGVCVRYQSCPKNNHLLSAKRIIKYINSTSEYGLLYTLDTSSSLVAYYDVD
ncbi:uncharacterized mitochondrial protein AtMg00810-like [Benincasa hispida]|uniref:uncharacterized mitochondrial protein AtMg00810-like n=1 Tax=Benincasa hispida TaxID=102211 RepID=UPI00190127EE|nr:uncharacterized mitochondrial protein AtMg00810-like [Benincasa hispida]